MMLGSAAVAGRLEALAACGAAIAVDDFGTGYSTLTTLCSLPIDIVKIDRSFVARGPSDRADRAVIEAIVQMAGKLGMRTVAEGVERVAEEDFVRAAGADCVQGYLHLRPTPAAAFSAWLDAHVAGVREDDRRAGITRLAGRRSG
jgi:EAL domain-containing protein (putative c-di-GMP-specific phosphodiesterase class I)